MSLLYSKLKKNPVSPSRNNETMRKEHVPRPLRAFLFVVLDDDDEENDLKSVVVVVVVVVKRQFLLLLLLLLFFSSFFCGFFVSSSKKKKGKKNLQKETLNSKVTLFETSFSQH